MTNLRIPKNIEKSKNMKVFVVLEWFYEGDSYLINSFKGVKSTYEEAKGLLRKEDFILEESDFETYKGKRSPLDWGRYGSESRCEIREVEL